MQSPLKHWHTTWHGAVSYMLLSLNTGTLQDTKQIVNNTRTLHDTEELAACCHCCSLSPSPWYPKTQLWVRSWIGLNIVVANKQTNRLPTALLEIKTVAIQAVASVSKPWNQYQCINSHIGMVEYSWTQTNVCLETCHTSQQHRNLHAHLCTCVSVYLFQSTIPLHTLQA
jgi:hypothetical protein